MLWSRPLRLIHLLRMIVEVPVVQDARKDETHVQHVVNRIGVEKPKIVEETAQMKPIIQDKINQVTKHFEVPQVQFLYKVDEMPIGVQRQIPIVQVVQNTMEIPQLQWC